MKIEEIRIDEISNHERNPKQHPDKQIRLLEESIKRFGWTNPVILSADNVILAGHARVKAAIAAGNDTVPCIRTKLTGQEADAYLLADNRLSDIAPYDRDILAELLSDLPKDLVDITGFDSVQVDALLSGEDIPDIEKFISDSQPEEPREEVDAEPQIDRAAELNKKWQVQLGDLWQCGDHFIICGDCTDPAVVERVMGGEKAELCFTSPPYSDMREYKGGIDLSLSKIVSFIKPIYTYSKYLVINLGIQRKNTEVSQYWNEYIQEAKDAGYLFLSWNVWSKRGMGGSIANMSAMFRLEHEWLFVFGKEPKELNKTQKNKSAGLHTGISNRQRDGTTKLATPKIVEEYGRLSSVVELCYGTSKEHPAVFPVNLPSEYIEAITDLGQYVIEPFLGSGTTMIACENTGRKCRGIEISPDYCAVILQRFKDATGKEPERINE